VQIHKHDKHVLICHSTARFYFTSSYGKHECLTDSALILWPCSNFLMLLIDTRLHNAAAHLKQSHLHHSEIYHIKVKKKGKSFSYSLPSVGLGADPGVQAVSLQVTISHPPGGRLPILTTRPAVTFPAAEHHRPLAGTKLYCFMTHRCKQLVQGCYEAFAQSRIWSHDLLIASPTLYLLHHLT